MEAQGDNENMEVDGAGHARAGSTDDAMGVEAAAASDGGAVEQPHEPVIVHVEVVMQENSRMRPADARGHVRIRHMRDHHTRSDMNRSVVSGGYAGG